MIRFCSFLFFISFATVAQPQLLWKFQTQGKIYSSPSIDNNVLFIGSGDYHVYAIESKTGALCWKYRTDGAVHSSPISDGHSVFFSSHDGNVYAVSRMDGSLRWKFATKGERIYDMWDYYQLSPTL